MEESLAFALITAAAAGGAVGFTVSISAAWTLYKRYSCTLRRPSCGVSALDPSRRIEACWDSAAALCSRIIRRGTQGYVEGKQPPPKILLPWEALPTAARAAPSYWQQQDLEKESVVRLAAVSSADHEALQALLNAAGSGGRTQSLLQRIIRPQSCTPPFLHVVSCKRVENSALWRSFAAERHAVVQKWQRFAAVQRLKTAGDVKLPGTAELRGDANEVYLWYSCGGQAEADGIIENGFMPDACSRFSFSGSGREADAALAKAQSGLYCLLLCRVVLGKIDWAARRRCWGWGSRARAARSVLSGESDSVACDSAAERIAVYRKAVAYPEYVVFYHRSFEPSAADALRV